MQSIGVVILMAAVMFSDRYRYAQIVLNFPLIKWIGMLSYSLYVWHFLVVFVLRKIVLEPASFKTASIGLLSFLCCRSIVLLRNREAVHGIASSFWVADGLGRA